MTIFGRVVRWMRGRPLWAGNRYNPGDTLGLIFYEIRISAFEKLLMHNLMRTYVFFQSLPMPYNITKTSFT